ncbi:MAG: tetratricopeptide repeat protein [Pseudomonadota bacterium]|nr:tetratricopeptide repeat protein [Pseudomonadota bacterium]
MTTPTRKFAPRPALLALALAMTLPVAAPAWAQQDYGNVGSQSMRAKRDAARKAKEAAGKGEEVAAALFPQATREQPETKTSRAGTKRLQDMVEAYQDGDTAKARAEALEIANDAESSAYEKAFAYQIAGTAASNDGDDAAAAEYFGKAIATNGLDNNDHYTSMLNLAVVQFGLDQYPAALETVDRFLAETKSNKKEAQSLRGGILMQMERYAEAAAIYSAQLAADPEDRTARMNAVAAYQQADQNDKAVALLADAHAKGQLTEANEYRALYVSYLNAERDKDALALIDDGLANGVLKADPELSTVFMILGQNAYYDSDLATAIEMYKRAVPMAADGEAALNLAKIYAEAGQKADASAAAKQALEKGVKNTDEARRLAGGQ